MTRYEQLVDAARTARSVIRLQLNGVPLPLETLAAIDAGNPYWRNQPARPQMAGALYDLIAVANIPDSGYSLTVDVVRAAPIPGPTDFIQLGTEDIDEILNYAVTTLMVKVGGSELKETMSGLQDFMDACSRRNQILKVKAVSYKAIFGQPQSEQEQRPDRMERKPATISQ